MIGFLSGKMQIVHANRLRFYSEQVPESEILVSDPHSEKLFEIDELIHLRSGRRGWEILVSWTDEDRTWYKIFMKIFLSYCIIF